MIEAGRSLLVAQVYCCRHSPSDSHIRLLETETNTSLASLHPAITHTTMTTHRPRHLVYSANVSAITQRSLHTYLNYTSTQVSQPAALILREVRRFQTQMHDLNMFNQKLSYCKRTARRIILVEILSTSAQMFKKITFGRACSRWMTLKVTQGHPNCHYLSHISRRIQWSAVTIGLKNVFTFFLFGHVFYAFILSTFFIFKKRWQNRRVSKRKNGNEIIQFNNIIHFSFFSVRYRSVKFSGLQILKYCMQQTYFRLYLSECWRKKLQNFVV